MQVKSEKLRTKFSLWLNRPVTLNRLGAFSFSFLHFYVRFSKSNPNLKRYGRYLVLTALSVVIQT